MTVLAWFDTETTGIDAATDEICQFASVVHRDTDPLDKTLSVDILCNPGKPIPPEAAAVHGISDEMVANAAAPRDVVNEWYDEVIRYADGDNIILGGHNTGFDWKFIQKHKKVDIRVLPLCTMRMARRMDPRADNHKLEYLYRERYKLSSARTAKAHDALCDVWMCVEVMDYWAKNHGLGDYWTIANELLNPILLEVMPFGKHKGVAFNTLPLHYLRWLAKQDESMDMDVRYTAGYLMGKR